MPSLERRLMATVVAATLAGFGAAGLATTSSITATLTREFDARLLSAAQRLSTGVYFTADGSLIVADEPSSPEFARLRSGWHWMIADDAGPISRSRSLRTDSLPADLPRDRVAQRIVGPSGDALRAVALQEVIEPSQRTLVFVVSAPAAPLDEEVRDAALRLAAWLAFCAAATLVVVAWLVRSGLRPLFASARDVTRLRGGDLESLQTTGYREPDALIDAVNILLADARRTVTRSRLAAANLAHAIKTPLAALKARTALVAPDDPHLSRDVQRLERQVERQLRRARWIAAAPALGAATPAFPVLDDVRLVASRSRSDRAIDIVLDVAPALRFPGPREALEDIAAPLVDNAVKWARTQARIAAGIEAGCFVLSVEDDGPGMADDQMAQALQPGMRLDDAVPGTGLGLSIAQETAEQFGATLDFQRAALGGLAAVARWPAPGG